jgi:hypothetical protein
MRNKAKLIRACWGIHLGNCFPQSIDKQSFLFFAKTSWQARKIVEELRVKGLACCIEKCCVFAKMKIWLQTAAKEGLPRLGFGYA